MSGGPGRGHFEPLPVWREGAPRVALLGGRPRAGPPSGWVGWVAGRPRLGGGWHRRRPLGVGGAALRPPSWLGRAPAAPAVAGGSTGGPPWVVCGVEKHRVVRGWAGRSPAAPALAGGGAGAALGAGSSQLRRCCCLSVQSINHQSRGGFCRAVRGKKSRWRVQGREAPPLARWCARCGRCRCSRARVSGRIAMLTQRVAVVQVRSGMWQPVDVLCAHGAMMCNVM